MKIDLMVADEATAYTGLSRAELASKVKPWPFRATPGIVWYLFADITALRGQQGTETPTPEDGHRTAAPVKPSAKKPAVGKSAGSVIEPVQATEDPALFDSTADPYPIDPETEAEELSRRPKVELQTMAIELSIPHAATFHRRTQIAEAIVTEKARQWYAKQPKKADAAVTAKVTPIRARQGKTTGRRGTTGQNVVTAVVGGGKPQFSDGSN